MTIETTQLATASPQLNPVASFARHDLASRRRAEILCGTIRVISRDGLNTAKLKDIARESGVSLGLIQHYFDTRDNLIDEAFGAMMRVISRGNLLRTSEVTDPLQFIYEVIRLHVFGTVSFPERWGFWSELWAASGRSDHLRGVSTQVYELWALPIERAFEQMRDQGRLPQDSDPAQLTIALLALMDGLAIRTLAEPQRFSQTLMLSVLNDWATTQLGVDRAEAALLIAQISADSNDSAADTLTPEIIADTLFGD